MAAQPCPAIRRLLQDLKQLKQEPIVGINAEPFGNNLLKWYGIVLGVEGTPFSGIPVRFSLEFSTEYPLEAPKAYFDTVVNYVGGASYRDSTGRLYVCLNLFSNTLWISAQSEGWAPSYTVQTILISIQALMMSSMLSKKKNAVDLMTQSAMEFKCPITGHVGSDRSKWFPQVITDPNVAQSIAMASGLTGYDPLRDFYICYVNKSTARQGALMGYGVHLENPRLGTLSSPCEYLSRSAYLDGTKFSSTNKPIENWIPILVHPNQWPRVRSLFLNAVNSVARRIRRIPRNAQQCQKVFKVCSSIMNSLVVEIMNCKGNRSANDKFINGYVSFYRLLLAYAKEDFEIVEMADSKLACFIESPKHRTKSFVENLGELLIFLMISSKYKWADIATPFIAECDARNVFWYIVGNRDTPARFPELTNSSVLVGRAAKVFAATEVSENLVMYQTRLAKIATTLKVEVLDSNCGLAPDDLRHELKDIYNLVKTVNSWDDFFNWLEMPTVSEDTRNVQLLEALKTSESQGYHSVYKRNYNGKNNPSSRNVNRVYAMPVTRGYCFRGGFRNE